MDKLQWFKFAPSDWMMGKIQRCPEITQSRYMRLCCLYWNKECVLTYEDAEIDIDEEHLKILIKKTIIKLEDNFIKIEFLDEQMSEIMETSSKRRAAVEKRWEKHRAKNDTSVSENDTSVLQSDTEGEKEGEKELDNNTPTETSVSESEENTPPKNKKKKKEKLVWAELIKFFNEKTGLSKRVVSEKVKAKFNARLREGYTREDIANTIINGSKSTYHKENNYEYFTLEYCSRSDTIDKYADMKTNDSEKVKLGMNT